MTSPNDPVLVGVAQRSLRSDDPREAPEPLDLLEEVARAAARDAAAGDALLGRVDHIGLTETFGWSPRNGPRLLAERLAANPRQELVTPIGGESALTQVNHAAREILAGRSRVALLAGTNNLHTLLGAKRRRIRLDWSRGDPGSVAARPLYRAQPGHSEREERYGLVLPIQYYPVFENALRARRGLDLETHRQRMGRLFHRFSRVAAANPHAWFPTERSAEELVTVTSRNRMVAFPYPKYLNAVMETDQAAAVLVVAREVADALGIDETRRVHWWGGSAAIEEPWFASERPRLDDAPALRRAVGAALAEARVDLEQVGAFDFYSCFPVAVAMACEMLGVDEDDPRGLTVTGGLPYAGGPGNNYCMHALAAMAERLREHPERPGLVTGVGWYLTRHSATLLGVGPRARAEAPVRDDRAPVEPVAMVDEAAGTGHVEGYTVLYDRAGEAERGIVIGRQEDGRRFLAHTPDDPSLLEAFVAHEQVGSVGKLRFHAGLNRFEPG